MVPTLISAGYSGTDASAYATGNGSPTEDFLQLLEVATSRATSDPSVPTSVTGCGLTWELEETVLYRQGTASNYRVSVYRALGTPSGLPDAVDVDFGGETQTSCALIWLEVPDVDTGGTNGSGALVQSVPANGTGLTPTATLAAFGSGDNLALMFAALRESGPFDPDGGGATWQELGDVGGSTPILEATSIFQEGDADLSPATTMSVGTGSSWGAIALEIKAASSAIQKAAPVADSVDGAWTTQAGGSALAAAIDETTPEDADYITSEASPSTSPCRVKLDSLGDPESSTGHIIRWRISKDVTGGGTIGMTVSLYQGGGDVLGAGTLIADFVRANVSDAWTTFEETLSAGEANAITDYGDLYVEFEADES